MTAGDAWRRAALAIDRRATPRAIGIAGYVVFLLYAFPGYLTTESADQLVDSRTRVIGDWHSPAMSVVWWLVEAVVAGSFGMLVVQSGLVLVGAYHLVRRVAPPRCAALAACAVLLFPPVLAPLAVVWRDAQMAGFLLAGAAAVTSARRPVKLVGLGLLFLGCAMRDTAVLAALPIAVLGFTWRDARWWQRGAIAVAAWAVVALGALWLNAAVTEVVTLRDPVARATADILGVLRSSGELGDAELTRELAGTPLAARDDIQARARKLGNRASGAAASEQVFDAPATVEQREAMLAARGRLARAHPLAYLSARWRVLYRIAIGRSASEPVYIRFLERPEQHAVVGQLATHAWTQRRLTGFIRWLGKTWLFLPGVYFALAVVLLPIAVRRRQGDAAMLLASGIAHIVAVMFLATAPQNRLAHWTVLCVWLAAVLLIAQRFAPRFARPPAARS